MPSPARAGSAKVTVPIIIALIAGAGVLFTLTVDRGTARVAPPVVVSPASAPIAPANPTTSTAPALPTAASPTPAPAPDARVQGERRWGRAEPIARPEGTIRFANYNVENLFDHVDDPALSGNDEDLDDAKPDDECKAVAAAIKAINPDILALQEIESEAALRWFRDTYLSDLGYTHLVSVEAGDGRGIEQAVLSRFPIRDVKNWPNMKLEGTQPERWGNETNANAGEPIVFARSPLRVTIDLPHRKADPVAKGSGGASIGATTPLTLFIVHHKSGGPGDYWREAEAKGVLALSAEFTKEHPDQPTFICGDFNARPTAQSIAMYLSAGWKDTFADRVKDDPSWITHSSGRVIDFILANDAAAKLIVPETRFVLGTPDRPLGLDWRTTPNPHGWASDHYPVVLDLRLP